MARLNLAIALLLAVGLPADAVSPLHALGAQGINLWKLQHTASNGVQFQTGVESHGEQYPVSVSRSEFEAQYFTQPLDHFSNTSHTFSQRYWINTRHYKAGTGGPVIVLDGGETSGEDRIPFLDTGIVEILARATGGVGVVLEHRYYGESVPVLNFSTDSLRWLNNAQAAADSANFISNVKFAGIEEDLTAPNTPWIYYGGSYAGARAAHMRVLYPDLVFGAIASSGVTHASLENWEYLEIIRKAADPKCAAHLENSVATIDALLSNPITRKPIKSLFGLADLQHDEDFASLISNPIYAWQSKNWDPKIDSTAFEAFCEALGTPPIGHPGPHSDQISYGQSERLVEVGGLSLDFSLVNYAHYVKENIVSQCPDGEPIEECFGTFDDDLFQGTSLDQTWRLWLFQVCTEWGYFSTAPPKGHPRIISRLLTLEYQSRVCHQAFPAGKHFAVPHLPNITVVNALGDYSIAADRLAIIDGEVDPWRPVTPHSEYAEDRDDTILRPFKLIPGGVHHYDEFGLKNIGDEPPEIRKIHGEMIVFVLEWLKDWKVAE